MRAAFLRGACAACATLSLLACTNVGVGTDVGSGGSGGTTTMSAGGTVADASTGGISCGTDPQSGVTLCEQVSACPGLAVDQGAFPGCGFRLGGAGRFDLECLCSGESLCPIGVPTTCADAAQLLDQAQSALTVCQAVDQGGCLQVGGADAGSSSSTPSSSGCDRACESECQSDPGCVALCGC
jgi:hypothetical protein